MLKKLKPEEFTCIDSISEFCKEFKGIKIPQNLKKYFLKVIFDYYDQLGPGSFEDIKSEIYVFDKANFAFDFFQKHGFLIFDLNNSDLYLPHPFRSRGYKKAYAHTKLSLEDAGSSL